MSEPREPIRVEAAEGGVFIVRGPFRLPLSGPRGDRILATFEHMQTHGEQWAQTYIMGVIDGFSHEWAKRTEEVIEGSRRMRERTAAELEEILARLPPRRFDA